MMPQNDAPRRDKDPRQPSDGEDRNKTVDVNDIIRQSVDLLTETVLTIYDEHAVRNYAKIYSSPSATPSCLRKAAAGINVCREKRGGIHLVILGIIIPKMGGNEVFRSLKSNNKDIIIILYSSYNHSNFAGINEPLQNGEAGFFQ